MHCLRANERQNTVVPSLLLPSARCAILMSMTFALGRCVDSLFWYSAKDATMILLKSHICFIDLFWWAVRRDVKSVYSSVYRKFCLGRNMLYFSTTTLCLDELYLIRANPGWCHPLHNKNCAFHAESGMRDMGELITISNPLNSDAE